MLLLCTAPHVYGTAPDSEAQRFVPGTVYDIPDPQAIRFLADWGPDSPRLGNQEPRFAAYVEPVEDVEEPAEGPVAGLVFAEPLDSFTIAELQVIARAHGVDLTGKSLKADIIAAIEGDPSAS